MAGAFAISVPLLDSDLAQFIYAGRLSCKIDKVRMRVGCKKFVALRQLANIVIVIRFREMTIQNYDRAEYLVFCFSTVHVSNRPIFPCPSL